MNKNNSIFVSMALVATTLVLCGKNIDFLLYTILGRIIIVLTIIGLTMVNKYVGIFATIIVAALYNVTYYKEGFREGGFGDHDDEDEDDDDEDDEHDDGTQKTPGCPPCPPTPSGNKTSSSSANFSPEESDMYSITPTQKY